MTDQVATAVDADQLKKLDDAHWRRLGITQTFDRLLVEAVAAAPGPAMQVQSNVARSLTGGAVKFWELSFPNLVKDLNRRGHLRYVDGQVQLGDRLREQLDRIIEDLNAGASHVNPTPGVTLEEVLSLSRQREERAKVKAAAARSATRTRTAKATDEDGEPKTRKRSTSTEGGTSTRAPKVRETTRLATSEPSPVAAPDGDHTHRPEEARKLFTSIRINRLFDTMATTSKRKADVGRTLEMGGQNLDRFLQVTNALEVTRITSDGLTVELHFRGQELSRTQAGERRQAVTNLVRDLRAYAEAED